MPNLPEGCYFLKNLFKNHFSNKYICKSQVFKSGACLRLHMPVHTDERPFECPHCHFVRKIALNGTASTVFNINFLYFYYFSALNEKKT